MPKIVAKGLSTKDFKRAMLRESEVLMPRYVREVHAQIAMRLYQSVLEYTPVLTGRARTNWFVAVGSKNNGGIDLEQAITAPGTWHKTTGEPLTSEETAAKMGLGDMIRRAPIGQKVWITNRLQYIGVLEDGYSQKAPAGMVEVSIDYVLGAGQTKQIGMAAAAVI